VVRFLNRLMDAQSGWARPLGDFNKRWLGAIYRAVGPLKDVAHGRWLGHPVHSATTDVPIGALAVTVVLDLANQRLAADISLVIGILAMLVSALVGAADYVDTDGRALQRATIHSTLMVVALVVYLVSLLIRYGNPADRTVPVVLSIVAFLILTAGAYVGGEIVYVFGNMVSRHAFRGVGAKWLPLEIDGGLTLDQLVDGQPAKGTVGINTLVLVRQGTSVHALHETCAHAGGPLAQGTVVDGCIQCPWHGSRFRLSDGAAQRGPTVYDQPAYEIRQSDHGLEAHRVQR
jgi:nitrite reductase/ring-hydroxylating ferredoxin subunit/uncharacterized membrane protein